MQRQSVMQLYNFFDSDGVLPIFIAAAELYSHVDENFDGAANYAAMSIVFHGLRARLKTTLGKSIDDDALDALVDLVRVIR